MYSKFKGKIAVKNVNYSQLHLIRSPFNLQPILLSLLLFPGHSPLIANVKCLTYLVTYLNSSPKFRAFWVKLDGTDCVGLSEKMRQYVTLLVMTGQTTSCAPGRVKGFAGMSPLSPCVTPKWQIA